MTAHDSSRRKGVNTMNKLFHLTKQGVDELQAELEELTGQRSVIADRIKTAREFGDLGENMEYTAARQDQERNESRITEIEHILSNVQVITAPKGDSAVVLGSSIKLKSVDGKTKEFQVVGTVEADPLNGKISDESPIGKALMGKREGDEVEIKTPAETVTYKIVDIS
ncbi:MAG TPA: transcription elongation factor GreA [Patescibacteria group bacterium]|nr:transcription elongation factor GreA [Patescibacteria group bacterium]